ncbi:hypothetical protein U1Q18_051357 [Sarracenia purpurea var. burkii]
MYENLATTMCLCAVLVTAEPPLSNSYLPPQEGYSYNAPSIPFPSPSPSPSYFTSSPAAYKPPVQSTYRPTPPAYKPPHILRLRQPMPQSHRRTRRPATAHLNHSVHQDQPTEYQDTNNPVALSRLLVSQEVTLAPEPEEEER